MISMNCHLRMPKHQPALFWWFSCSSISNLSFGRICLLSTTCFAQLFKLPLPRRIRPQLAGYVFQEDFQCPPQDFHFWQWLASHERTRVYINVHCKISESEWQRFFRYDQLPVALLWCPRTVSLHALCFSLPWPVLAHRAGDKQWTAT